jgi:hypothetical protein
VNFQLQALATLHPWEILEYVIRKSQENEVGLKFSGTHQLLVYVDDVNLLGDSVINIKRTQKHTEASRNIGLEINLEKSKYLIMPRYTDSGRSQNIRNCLSFICRDV